MSFASKHHGPVDLLMSEPLSHFSLPSSPPSSDPLSPSSTLSPISPPLHSSSPASPLAASVSLDSPSSVAAFVQRLRDAGSTNTRLVEASKLANVQDDDVKQSFIEQSGVSILLTWLEPSSVNNHHVIEQTIEALSILPLASATSSYPADQLQSVLRELSNHANHSVSQAAGELLASLASEAEEEKRTAEEQEEEEEAAVALSGGSESKFHLIKIDKTTTEQHPHHEIQSAVSAVKAEPSEFHEHDQQGVTFDTPLSPTLSPTAKEEADSHAVSDDKQKQRNMTDKMDVADERDQSQAAAADNDMLTEQTSNKKRKRLSVRWVEDERLEDLRWFFKDEVIVRKEKKKPTAADTQQDDKSAIDWYTPPPLTQPPSQQTVGIVPVSSDERAGKRQAAFPGVKPSTNEGAAPAADLLSSLNSLASMLSSSSSSSGSASASSSPQPASSSSSSTSSSSVPSAAVSAGTSSSLSALLSNLSALSAGNGTAAAPQHSDYSVPTPSSTTPPAPPSSGGASRLLSLLSNSSALSGLAASLTAPANPPPQPQYQPPPPAQQPYPPAHVGATSATPPPSYYSAPPPYATLPSPQPTAAAPLLPPPSYRAPLGPPPAQSAYYPPSSAPYAGYGHSQPPPLLPTPPSHGHGQHPPPPSAYPPPPAASPYPSSLPSAAPQYPPASASAPTYPPAPGSSPYYPPPPAGHYGGPPAASPYAPTMQPPPPPTNGDPYAQHRAAYHDRYAGQQPASPWADPSQSQQQRTAAKRKRMDERPTSGPATGGDAAPDMSKFKTRPCAAWSAGKPCRYGDKCTFIHDARGGGGMGADMAGRGLSMSRY